MVTRPTIQSRIRALIASVLLIAVAAVGLVHAAPMTDRDQSSLLAFVQAGGDPAQLCADADGDGRLDHQDCPACRLMASIVLPVPAPAILPLRPVLVTCTTAPRASRAVAVVRDPAHGLRAPPAA